MLCHTFYKTSLEINIINQADKANKHFSSRKRNRTK